MALNRKALGTTLLTLEKGKVEDVKELTLDSFALVTNVENGEDMVCFKTVEKPDTYFWASTSLHRFLVDNVENAMFDSENLTYSFPDDTVVITHNGKVPLKSDNNKSANVWIIDIN